MNCYQKFYTNQIHSSSLLCQLATMWKSQVLCDAVIKAGSTNTKAHRVVLVAACPMLQSMKSAAVGSHLEVRLASDIKEESINTFLQYLYEGFMLLTEENCKDVEKIGRLLQVDSVIKCCADFFKCLSMRTGTVDLSEQYRYNSFENAEYRHVRSSEMLKTAQERLLKRGSSHMRPSSPGTKRARYHRASPSFPITIDDTVSMSQSYTSTEPIRESPRSHQRSSHPGVIDIVEDSLELLQTDPSNLNQDQNDPEHLQNKFSVGVSSRIESNTNIHTINLVDNSTTEVPPARFNTEKSHPVPVQLTASGVSSSSVKLPPQPPKLSDHSRKLASGSTTELREDNQQLYISPLHSLSRMKAPQTTHVSPQSSKSFAVGSPSQNFTEIPTSNENAERHNSKVDQSEGDHRAHHPPDASRDSVHDPPPISVMRDAPRDHGEPDLTLVKMEHEDPDLDMYVGVGEDGMMQISRGEHGESTNDDESNQTGDWNTSMGHDASWMMDQSQYTGDQVAGVGDLSKLIQPSPEGASLPDIDDVTYDSRFIYMQDEIFDRTNNITHKITPTENSKLKHCVFCHLYKVKTKSGWRVSTRTKCDRCDVPLCKMNRNCFKMYHRLIDMGVVPSQKLPKNQQSISQAGQDRARYSSTTNSQQAYRGRGQSDTGQSIRLAREMSRVRMSTTNYSTETTQSKDYQTNAGSASAETAQERDFGNSEETSNMKTDIPE